MFANRNVENEDYYETDIPYQVHPISNHMRSKQAFSMSKHERKAINRLVYLIENGVTSERLSSQGFGESKPIASNKTKNGKALNRRVEVKVVK